MKHVHDGVEFTHMVSVLAKPGEQIVQTLTPEDAHKLHMVLGFAGECGELIITRSASDAKEELGDMEFYLEGLRQGYNIQQKDLEVAIFNKDDLERLIDVDAMLHVVTGDLIDVVKRHVIYRKPVELYQVKSVLIRVDYVLSFYYLRYKLTRGEVLDGNIQKLIINKNARYKLGTYSDEQANARADKA